MDKGISKLLKVLVEKFLYASLILLRSKDVVRCVILVTTNQRKASISGRYHLV